MMLAKLAWFFFVTGAFTFGGGLAVVPLLEKGLVQQGHWLSAADFLTAVAVGMLTPGPVMTAATFAGYLVAGVPGALVCTVAIYLPSFLLVLFAAPPLMRHRGNPLVQGFVKGGLRGRHRRHPGCVAAARLARDRRLGHHRHRGGKPCRPDHASGSAIRSLWAWPQQSAGWHSGFSQPGWDPASLAGGGALSRLI